MTLNDMTIWVTMCWARWLVYGESIVTRTGVVVRRRPDCEGVPVR